MNIVAYLHFVAFWIFIVYIYLILRKGINSLMNRSFAALLAAMTFLSFTLFFVQNIYVPKHVAMIFRDLSAVGWASIASLFLLFIIVSTGNVNKFANRKTSYIVLLPAFFFIYLQFSHKLVIGLVKTYYGWGLIWTNGIWYYAYWGYCFISVSVAFVLIIRLSRNSIDPYERKLSLFAMLNLWPALLMIFVADGLLPKLHIRVLPEMSDLISIYWCGLLLYLIIKYNFFLITPTMAAENIIETMGDSLILMTGSKRIVEVNPYTLELLGYRKDELIDKDIDLIFSRDDKGPFNDTDLEKLIKDGFLHNHSVEYRAKSGNKIPVSLTAAVRYDNFKRTEGIIIIAKDIRDMIQLHKQEKELASVTATAEAERMKAEELKKAYDQLKRTQAMLIQSEKMRTMGNLGSSIIRKIKKPMSDIITSIKNTLNDLDPQSEGHTAMNDIYLKFLKVQKLLEDFYNYVKESSDEIEAIDINGIIDSSLSLCVHRLRNKNMVVNNNYEDALHAIRGHKRHIQQVVINIIDDAAEILPEGSTLDIITRSVTVNDKKYIEADFIYCGFFMSEEEMDSLFGEVFEGDGEGKGVWFRMMINHLVVTTLGGEIYVNRKIGRGTVFTIRFPEG